MSVFKIALVQQKAIPNDKNKNLELALQYIKAAGDKGADMVLFPEMWSNGYAPPFEGAFDDPLNPAFEKERQAWFEKAVTLQSDYLDAIKKAAAHMPDAITNRIPAASAATVMTELIIRTSEIGSATRFEIRKYAGKVRKCHHASGAV